MTTPNPCRSLYVHVPFCRSLCGYCDFHSELLDPAAVAPLVDTLLRELETAAAAAECCFDTIYVGGGTPTVLPPAELERLLLRLRAHAEPDGLEFTVEANPATVSSDIAAALVAAGVNRVSLGAQSFQPAELRVLQRAHQPAQVRETVATCRRFGLRSINLDLIFGIPGQTLASWRSSLQAALELRPEHLSCYGLTYEADTPLRTQLDAGLVHRVNQDLEAEMYELILDLLPAAGLAHYEISNFARPGAECRHNLHCWHNQPYLGIGPAAAGFIDEVRYRNVADTPEYIQAVNDGRPAWCEHERLTPDQRARETAMLELRLTAGIDRQRFAERYGSDPAHLFADAVARHVADGLLEVVDSAAPGQPASIRLTRAGLLLADTVMADFL